MRERFTRNALSERHAVPSTNDRNLTTSRAMQVRNAKEMRAAACRSTSVESDDVVRPKRLTSFPVWALPLKFPSKQCVLFLPATFC
jgi:hypothetical protein